MNLSFEQTNEIEARKSLVRRDLAYGFNEDDICQLRAISKKILRDTVKLIHKEDTEYLMRIKEGEIASDVRIMKQRFLDIYRDARLMYADIKNDNQISVRDKTDLLRFMGEVSTAILKIDTEGVTLIKNRSLGDMVDKVEDYKQIHQLTNDEDEDPEVREEHEEPPIKEPPENDPQRVF